MKRGRHFFRRKFRFYSIKFFVLYVFREINRFDFESENVRFSITPTEAFLRISVSPVCSFSVSLLDPLSPSLHFSVTVFYGELSAHTTNKCLLFA